MKSYKDFDNVCIGGSDTASVILVGGYEKDMPYSGLKLDELHFGEDGTYYAYFVNEPCEIGSHYTKVATFSTWLKIYDDDGLAFKVDADEINIYRSGDFGCIIEVKNEQ